MANAEFWEAKLLGNVRRDQTNDELLRRAGWTVLRFWEHQLIDEMVARITSAIRALDGQPIEVFKTGET